MEEGGKESGRKARKGGKDVGGGGVRNGSNKKPTGTCTAEKENARRERVCRSRGTGKRSLQAEPDDCISLRIAS